MILLKYTTWNIQTEIYNLKYTSWNIHPEIYNLKQNWVLRGLFTYFKYGISNTLSSFYCSAESESESEGRNDQTHLKLCVDDGPNLYRVIKYMFIPRFIENTFRSGLTLVSSNDIMTIKIKNKKRVSQMEKRKRTRRSYDMQNDHLEIFTF